MGRGGVGYWHGVALCACLPFVPFCVSSAEWEAVRCAVHCVVCRWYILQYAAYYSVLRLAVLCGILCCTLCTLWWCAVCCCVASYMWVWVQVDMEAVYVREGDAPLKQLEQALATALSGGPATASNPDPDRGVGLDPDTQALCRALKGVVWTRSFRWVGVRSAPHPYLHLCCLLYPPPSSVIKKPNSRLLSPHCQRNLTLSPLPPHVRKA